MFSLNDAIDSGQSTTLSNHIDLLIDIGKVSGRILHYDYF